MEQERIETVMENNKQVRCNSHCYPTHAFDPENVSLCRCDCGREMYICNTCLVEGLITSCGKCGHSHLN
jgi:hypothetical protein